MTAITMTTTITTTMADTKTQRTRLSANWPHCFNDDGVERPGWYPTMWSLDEKDRILDNDRWRTADDEQ
jgi:hypothetical protein